MLTSLLGADKLWRRVIDHKYSTCNPNVFACTPQNASPFLKGVLWASRAAKMGYN